MEHYLALHYTQAGSHCKECEQPIETIVGMIHFTANSAEDAAERFPYFEAVYVGEDTEAIELVEALAIDRYYPFHEAEKLVDISSVSEMWTG